jgi:dGTPase
MAPRAVEPLQARQQEVLSDLARVLSERGPDSLERPFALDWSEARHDAGRLRVVVDQVAALTDVRAHEWHRDLVGT